MIQSQRFGVCRFFVLLWLVFLTPHLVSSQSEGRDISAAMRFPGTALRLEAPYAVVELLPHATLGSAVQAVGVRLAAHITLPEVLVLENIYFLFQLDYFYSFNNLGIPGGVHSGFFSGLSGVSVGSLGSLDNNFIPLGKRTHNVLFQYEYFIDSNNTSQALGVFAYYYSRPTWLLGVRAENDAFAFFGQDRFRTSAVDITALFETNGHVWGVGVGNVVWGGTILGIYQDPIVWQRSSSLDIRNNQGGRYSHGILYVAGYYDSFKLSIGVDAEEIRAFFQNGVHYLINIPSIAINPNIKPRFYVQLEINPRYSLF